MDNIFSKFSSNLQQALLMSERISREQNSKTDTDHQLLALILQKGTLANDILSMFDISIDRAQLVSSLVSHQDDNQNGVNDSAKQAIQLAVQLAMKYKHHQVDCEHLLSALISNKKFNSFHLIERMGIKPKEIKRQLDAVFSQSDKPNFEVSPPNLQFNISDDLGMDEADPMDAYHDMTGPAVKTRKNNNILREFTINISELAKAKKIDPVIGRDQEIERMIQTLIRRKKNNPVLIGEPGVGKTAIVEGLAVRINSGNVPPIMANKEILSLDLPALLAGTMYRGQFEIRIKKLFDEIIRKPNIVLFIDELHTVIGAGSAEGSLDAANILKPKLARGEIRVIGATTLDEYKKYIEKDAAFERRFQPITIKEPSIEQTIEILKGIAHQYETHHGVIYTEDALNAAARLSSRYIQDRFLPDKAIDLIDEAAAAIKLISKDSNKLYPLQKDYEKTIIDKDEAVSNEQYEKATFLRQKELSLKNKISGIEQHKLSKTKLVISEHEIAVVVSKWTGIPLTSLKTSERKRFINLEKKLSKYIVGQDEAISTIATAIRRSRVGISDPRRPIGSFIFLGPTGVGKTELVKVLAQEVFGSNRSLIKIDMSEFMEKHNLSRLVGAPAGYIGYDEGGQLTERVRRNPYSVILFDEIEKAHPEVFNILLQILEDGELSDAKGRRVDFRNTMIVMTSNLGTDFLNSQATIGFSSKNNLHAVDYEKMSEQVRDSVEKHFRPEFLNRLDQIVIFKPLNQSAISKIAAIEINKLIRRMNDTKIIVEITPLAIAWIAEKGFKPELGARPMRKVITDHIENPLSEMILREDLSANDTVVIGLKDNKIVLNKS